MKLEQYEARIKSIAADRTTSIGERAREACQLAAEINKAAWDTSHQSWATEVGFVARQLARRLSAVNAASANATLEFRCEGQATRKRRLSARELEDWKTLPGECEVEFRGGLDNQLIQITTASERTGGHLVYFSAPYRTHWIDFGKDFQDALAFAVDVVEDGWEAAISVLKPTA